MEVLFVPYSAIGHLTPTLAVVTELTRHDVLVTVVADARFGADVAASGARHLVAPVAHVPRVPSGYGPAATTERIRLQYNKLRAIRATIETVDAALSPRTVRLCVFDPHLPLIERTARRHRVAAVPLWTTHARRAGRGGTVLVNAVPELQPRRGRFGAGVHFVGPLSARPRPRPVSPRSRPVLVVASGSVFARPAAFFHDIVTAFADTPWTVVMATGDLPVAELGPLSGNVVAAGWIAQEAELFSADVFLTHAGMNSVHQAIMAGVPMLLAPRSAEQRRTADRLCELGVAAYARHGCDLRALADGLRADPLVRRRLQWLRERAEVAHGAERAADVLLELLGGPARRDSAIVVSSSATKGEA
ncbi:glycosyltransferase [Nocardia sp. NPDC058658]|uniref:glycosyltransferase n=1 Tax=Nocardia sp. NPDC058658 TaxID=3346580 RepID=UPI00365EBC2A